MKSIKVQVLVILAVFACVLGGCAKEEEIIVVDRARLRKDAVVAVLQAAESDNAGIRVHAMEVMPASLPKRGGVVCVQALSDQVPEVRLAAAMAIGDMKYAPAKAKLSSMGMYKEPGAEADARVYCAIIYALYEFGDRSHLRDLGTLAFDKRIPIRASTAIVLGKMGNPSALVLLKDMMSDEQDEMMKLEITKSMAMCGHAKSLLLLEPYARMKYVDERVLAIQAMAELKSGAAERVFSDRLVNDKSPMVRVAAAAGLATVGVFDEEAMRYCIDAAIDPRQIMSDHLGKKRSPTEKEVDSLRLQACRSLGAFDHDKSLHTLGIMMKSPDQASRVAAAASVLKLVPAPVRRAKLPVAKKAPQAVSPAAKPIRKSKLKLHVSGAKD